MLRRPMACTVLLSCLAGAANAADSPPLAQQLARESVADLAKAARDRGDAARGAILFFQPFLTCAK